MRKRVGRRKTVDNSDSNGTASEDMTTVFPLPSPTLPEFTTLLLKGPFHASAPIHLCLTHLANRPGSRAVLFTPSRENFITALRDLNDDWLNECGGYGAVSQVLSRVDVFYPPTSLHASVALSMLRGSRPEMAPSQLEISSPCLLLLHEFSSYFVDGETVGAHNLASYLSLLAHALTTLRFLSEQPSRPGVCLVLMDSRLDTLSLPVLKPTTHGPTDADLGSQDDAPYRVAFLMHHYFEWIGTFGTNGGRNVPVTFS
ncbi:hypothetical protein BC827DRAFT_402125 [Russula dissimulans]|nr:hypothetical protein BC827DRAFT_402125 [Russula dissimulans]